MTAQPVLEALLVQLCLGFPQGWSTQIARQTPRPLGLRNPLVLAAAWSRVGDGNAVARFARVNTRHALTHSSGVEGRAKTAARNVLCGKGHFERKRRQDRWIAGRTPPNAH